MKRKTFPCPVCARYGHNSVEKGECIDFGIQVSPDIPCNLCDGKGFLEVGSENHFSSKQSSIMEQISKSFDNIDEVLSEDDVRRFWGLLDSAFTILKKPWLEEHKQKENNMSTPECRKDCDVFEDWKKMEAQHTDLVQEKSKLEDEIHRYNNELSDALTQNEQMKRLIESYGNNPAGFDWSVLAELEKCKQLKDNNKKLKKFVSKVIREECWGLVPLDGGDIQEMAEELGLITKHTATEDDVDLGFAGFEVGDTIYRFADILRKE